MPHGDADVSGFESGAIVNTITGHRHHFAGPLQSLHDLQFVSWTDARKDMHPGGQRLQHIRLDRGELGRIQDFQRSVSTQVQLFGNGIGCGALVAGDHHGVDSRSMKSSDRVLHPRPDWIHHPHQAQPGQPVLDIDLGIVIRHIGVCGSEDAESTAGHALVFGLDAQPVFLCKR
jgi:hypothetical protein